MLLASTVPEVIQICLHEQINSPLLKYGGRFCPSPGLKDHRARLDSSTEAFLELPPLP